MMDSTLTYALPCPTPDPACPYTYELLVDELSLGSFSCESYGVRITGSAGDSAQVSHITVSPSRIRELMDLLTRNQVGPLHLRDVIDDWL